MRPVVAVVAAVLVLIAGSLVASAVHLLPQIRNPFTETTTIGGGPAVLKSITQLSRYEAASGEFQVVVDLTKSSFLPSFIQGSETLFVGVGSDNAFVDFSNLGPDAVQTSPDHTSATIQLPHAQLEPANLDVNQSYVVAEQQGLLNRIGGIFSGDPNSQQQAYIAATNKITAAARQSPLIGDAEKNTRAMLQQMLTSLGYKQITVGFA